MQLTRQTDLALRLLMHLATVEGGRATIAEVATAQEVPRSHLMKIANRLVHAGYLAAVRGRGGGIALARPPHEIRIGAVVAAMEPGCALVTCDGCRLVRRCSLPRLLDRGMAAFLAVLDEETLADVARLPARAQQENGAPALNAN